MTAKNVEHAVGKATAEIRAVYPDAAVDGFVEDGMFFLTANTQRGEDLISSSHAYTLDSMQSRELVSAAEDLASRVIAELRHL